jgi:WD40 repeat protein
MAFSPDGRILLFGCEDGLVRLWDVAAQHPQVTFDWVIGSIRCVAFAPDGLTAAVGGDGAIIVWDVDD